MPSDLLMKTTPAIEGESQDEKYPKSIEISSFSWGVNQEASMQAGAGLVAGGAGFGHFTVQKLLDKSSSKFYAHLCSGAEIQAVEVICRRPGEGDATATNNQQVEYLRYKFERVQVVSFSSDGSAGSAIPSETISMNFQKYTEAYKEMKEGHAQGVIQGAYDIKQNLK
ncbi:MAG: type VI secretion system tube protein Hcp [Acidobacteria bacterium]|nr:type VI secretion system tube protein Hcp [Acidobacteriota bacterium]